MDKGRIIKKTRNLSIPWFEQIEKTVILPFDPDQQIYYSIKPPDYVTALTHTTDNKFIILRQYRPIVEDCTFELPSGHIEEGETPAQAMLRELREEAGLKSGDVTLLGEFIPDTGRLENSLWAFYVNNVEIHTPSGPADNEGIEIYLVTKEDLFKMISDGKLNHALDLSVIAMAIIKEYLAF